MMVPLVIGQRTRMAPALRLVVPAASVAPASRYPFYTSEMNFESRRILPVKASVQYRKISKQTPSGGEPSSSLAKIKHPELRLVEDQILFVPTSDAAYGP
jgi:hypothetical protein